MKATKTATRMSTQDRILEMLAKRPAVCAHGERNINDAVILAAELLDALETLHNHAKSFGVYRDSVGDIVLSQVNRALKG